MYEAGTRVPFISYWKGKIEPKVSDAIICQMDLFASLAKLTGSELPVQDSENMLDVLMGKSNEGRDDLVIEAISRTAYRQGDWIMIPPYKGAPVNTEVNIELGASMDYQLYNLSEDISQQNNLASTHPDKLREMLNDFEKIRGNDYTSVKKLELK